MHSIGSLCVIYVCCLYATRGDVVKGPAGDIFVGLSTGQVRGRTIVTESGNRGNAFLGIPYAEPPLGEYRFAETKRKRGWSGTVDCLEYKAACMQNTSQPGSEPQHPISEDCLFANVFVGPNCTEGSPCPVVLYIHGGGHNFDSPRMFPPNLMVDNFASTGLVFITIAYRLGTFGFWNTGNDIAGGNWGLYDMREGLRWTRREVEKFGGDPHSVTIMGHSSSADDIGLLSVSPIAQGLFHRLIIMSGSGLKAGLLQDDSEVARSIAEKAGCSYPAEEVTSLRSSTDVLNCMRAVSAGELIGWQRALEEEEGLTWSGPRMDGSQGLFPQDPFILAKTRMPYPTLTGTTLYELSPPAAVSIVPNLTLSQFKLACKASAPALLPPPFLQEVSLDKVADLCADFYDRNDGFRHGLLQLASDQGMFVPVYEEAVSIRSTGAPVFLYSFDYVKSGLEGAFPVHAQDLTYVMGIHPFSYDDRDEQIQKIYPAFFANFAKYGNPTPWSPEEKQWKPLSYPLGANYFSVNLPEPKNTEGYHRDSVLFWTLLAPRIAGGNMLNRHTSQQNVSSDGTNNLVSPALQNLLQDTNALLTAINNGTGSSNVTVVVEEKTSTDWQTAFWITVAVAVLIVLGLSFSVGLSCCTAKKRERDVEIEEEADETISERSPLKGESSKFYS